MKSLLLILQAVFVLDASARDIDQSFTGSWYNAGQSGHGFSVEVLPDGRAVIQWYVYNPDGTPTFLVALGDIDGDTIHADVYHHTGMPFGTFDNSGLVQTHWGTLDFTVSDCEDAGTIHGAASYDFDANGIVVAGTDGEYGMIFYLEQPPGAVLRLTGSE